MYDLRVTTIRVEFIDAATGGTFAKSEVPSDELPETFELATQLHLGDADWQVDRAEPPTRAEYTRTRSLRVTLRKIVMIDPKTILFSLPTIENALPPLRAGDAPPARLHEDDWRQIELVAAAQEPAIHAELAAIREVLMARKAAGFERIHVRSRIPTPLAGVRLTVAELAQTLGSPMQGDLAFGAGALVVDGGFVFEAGALYGRQHDGVIVALGLGSLGVALRLTALATSHDLVLVDWCRGISRRLA